MDKQTQEQQITLSRRRVLAGLSALGAIGAIGPATSAWAEPPPETKTVRLPRWVDDGYCWAAAYLAGGMLQAEGFTDVRYVQGSSNADNADWIAQGETDFDLNMPPMHIGLIDAGVPITMLTGLHSGCFELIAKENIQSLTELRGKKVGVWALNSHPHVLVSLMVAYVGLDPRTEITWVTASERGPRELFIEGKVDAFLAAAPEPQLLRAEKIGHTILDNGADRPWSQYFCCMLAARTEYVTRYPVATKRILRAIIKGADLCASDPQRAAQLLVSQGFLPSYDNAFQTLSSIQYDRWREYDAEDSVRFYALRMQEIGMIGSSPQSIIANGTSWQFLNEIKRELKT